jgi:hypothetical protein
MEAMGRPLFRVAIVSRDAEEFQLNVQVKSFGLLDRCQRYEHGPERFRASRIFLCPALEICEITSI